MSAVLDLLANVRWLWLTVQELVLVVRDCLRKRVQVSVNLVYKSI